MTDSLFLNDRKIDGGCYFNTPFSSKFLDYSNFAQLLADQLSKKWLFFILLGNCSFTQGNLNAFVRSKIYIILSKWWGKERSLEQFVCFQSLNIRINMTQCVTSATAEWHLSLVFMIITKCRGKISSYSPRRIKNQEIASK